MVNGEWSAVIYERSSGHVAPVLCVGVLLGLLFAGPASALAQDSPPKVLDPKLFETQTDWYGLYLNGKKMGYCRIARESTEGQVREFFTLVMKVVSFGQKAELSMVQAMAFENKAPYRLLRGEFSQSDGKEKVKITVERKGDRFDVTHQAGGETTKKDHGPIDYTFVDATETERWIRNGPKEGSKVESKDLNLQELKIEPQTSTAKSVKKSLVAGVDVKYYEVETVSKQISMLSRYDEQGRMLSGKFVVFDIRLEPEQQAKNTEFSQDLFVLGMVKVDRPLGPTDKVRELVVEVAGSGRHQLRAGPAPDLRRARGRARPAFAQARQEARPTAQGERQGDRGEPSGDAGVPDYASQDQGTRRQGRRRCDHAAREGQAHRRLT